MEGDGGKGGRERWREMEEREGEMRKGGVGRDGGEGWRSVGGRDGGEGERDEKGRSGRER